MQIDFFDRLKAARAAVDVPPIPLEAIHRSALGGRPETKLGSRRITLREAVLSLAIVVATAGAATVVHLSRSHLSLNRSGATMLYPDGRLQVHLNSHDPPSAKEMRAAAASVDFSVTLPAGLPEDAKPAGFMRIGSDALHFVYTLSDARHRNHRELTIFLTDPQMLTGSSNDVVRPGRVEFRQGHLAGHFAVGGEEVIVFCNGLTSAEFMAIERAMRASRPITKTRARANPPSDSR
jgi:hypothetical protein